MWVPVAVRRVANCYTPFTFTLHFQNDDTVPYLIFSELFDWSHAFVMQDSLLKLNYYQEYRNQSCSFGLFTRQSRSVQHSHMLRLYRATKSQVWHRSNYEIKRLQRPKWQNGSYEPKTVKSFTIDTANQMNSKRHFAVNTLMTVNRACNCTVYGSAVD